MSQNTQMDKPAKSRPRKPRGGGQRAKLVVKLGNTEVHLEGDLAAVEKKFDRVMNQLAEAARPAPATTPAQSAAKPTTPVVAMRQVAARSAAEKLPWDPEPAPAYYPTLTLDLAEVAEFYSVNANNELLLRSVPAGLDERDRNADLLLLLIYGKLVLQGESPVTAVALLKSSDLSGLDIDRASRLLARRSRYVKPTGQRRGRRYALTQAGVEYCEKLLRRLASRPGAPGAVR